jgi:hypothetical protein
VTPSDSRTSTASERPITVDDLRRRAEQVVSMAKDEAQSVFKQEWATAVVIGAMAVVVAISFAYFIGTRAGRH